ncbi:hypothetical protein FACS1894217_02290 [Clostridia bacterium]|nr:hypothetical protein FACS1894217_02290 [Clostridia bacterium]
MEVVYIDSVFALNLILDYLLLLLSARLAGLPFRRWRLGVAAGFGAVCAVLAALPDFEPLNAVWLRALLSVPIALIAYGAGRYFWRGLLLFWVSSFVLAGAISALGLHTISIAPLLLTAAAAYLVLTFALKGFSRHAGKSKIVRVSVTLNSRETSFDALVDTGHGLTDPVSGQPIIVADAACVASLLPAEVRRQLDERSLSNPIGLFQRVNGGMFRLVPYQTIGAKSFLLAFRPDRLTVAGEDSRALVAISPTPMPAKNPYSALIGG